MPKSKIRRHFCYLLANSQGTGTYIGYSVNPLHRKRQHSGELTQGAKKTKHYVEPYLRMVVGPFETKTTALQFEWAWQHKSGGPTGTHERARIKRLFWLLSLPAWTRRSPLTKDMDELIVRFIDTPCPKFTKAYKRPTFSIGGGVSIYMTPLAKLAERLYPEGYVR